eukprot:TRINITY_DN3818_c0_g1_i2.p1 TRINITY_DN3818_c0_g1~~TRINITY_DN3818_c0_g1_i2.p1  ORF type:complete len:100 (+),score=5.20 TRINITY_DN3818_c0_g1_i2:124-423(+)
MVQRAKSISQAYVPLGVLSMHSIFDELGIGVEQSVGGFYRLLITIVAWNRKIALGVPIYNYVVVSALFSYCHSLVLRLDYDGSTCSVSLIGSIYVAIHQ